LPNVRNVTTRDDDRSSAWASSVPIGDPQITQIGLSVVSATSTRSWANGIDMVSSEPVMGTTTAATLGSATMVSRILRPRQSADGWPPLSTGFETRR
jgi:hypothetical protein